MFLSKSKCWYSNNCLHFLMRAVPLTNGSKKSQPGKKGRGYHPTPCVGKRGAQGSRGNLKVHLRVQFCCAFLQSIRGIKRSNIAFRCVFWDQGDIRGNKLNNATLHFKIAHVNEPLFATLILA